MSPGRSVLSRGRREVTSVCIVTGNKCVCMYVCVCREINVMWSETLEKQKITK